MKNILLAVTGLSAQVVTETLKVLIIKSVGKRPDTKYGIKVDKNKIRCYAHFLNRLN